MPEGSRGSVLLVEDELLVREVTHEDLDEAGFSVTTASDADEAIALLRDGRQFDLLFTDIRMPGQTDGWEVARQAKELLPGVKVIYATGLGEGPDDLTASECYVCKPYTFADVLQAVDRLGF